MLTGKTCEQMTTWRAGRSEHWRETAVSGYTTGVA